MDLDTSFITDVSLVGGALKATFGVLLLYFIYCYFNDNGSQYHHPPGPKGLPFLGSVLSMIFTRKHPHEVLDDWTNKYGDVMCIKLMNRRLYVISDVRLGQDVMGSMHAMDREPTLLIQTLTGRKNAGVAFANGEVWKEQRRLLMSVLKKADVDGISYDDIIVSQAERMLAEFEKTNGQSFDPRDLIHKTIGNVVMKILTGVTYDYDDLEFSRVMTNTVRVFTLLGEAGILASIPALAAIPSPTKWKIIKAWEEIYGFLKEIIERRKARFDTNQKATDFMGSFVKAMCAKGTEIGPASCDEINLMVSSFDLLLAGWDTISTTLAWGLHTLASYPEAQRRVHQEIKDVIGLDRLPQFSDHHSMPVTMATIAECMRFRPTLAVHIPHVATQDCKIGGYDIPKGGQITLNMW
eukprot:XP_011676507.1 PREDICTED: cytochrome P450 2J3 [Strongylocentrotus purpuratus]